MSVGPWDFGGFDIVVLLILGMSALMSFSRGFTREIVSVIALVVGLVAALFLFGRFQVAANALISPSWLANGALGLGAFFLAYMIVVFVLRGFTKKMQGREIGFFDRLLGFGFGVARGLLVAAFFVVISRVMFTDDKTPAWIEEATFYPVLSTVADKMLNAPFAQLEEAAQDTIDKGRELDPDAQLTAPN